MTSAQRLLNAEKQFSELADQLQNLKSAAQAIEQAGHATDQMRALAESAIATASSLGAKISETADILQKQNIPERLLEKESRLNAKFLDVKTVVLAADQKAEVLQGQKMPERLASTEARLLAKSDESSVQVVKYLRIIILLQFLFTVGLAYVFIKFRS